MNCTTRQAIEIQNCIWAVWSAKEKLNRSIKETEKQQIELDNLEKSLTLKWEAAAFIGLNPENINEHLGKIGRFS